MQYVIAQSLVREEDQYLVSVWLRIKDTVEWSTGLHNAQQEEECASEKEACFNVRLHSERICMSGLQESKSQCVYSVSSMRIKSRSAPMIRLVPSTQNPCVV